MVELLKVLRTCTHGNPKNSAECRKAGSLTAALLFTTIVKGQYIVTLEECYGWASRKLLWYILFG